MSEVACPQCGERDELRGSARSDGAIDLVCEVCSTTWQRDATRRCRLCGSTDLAYSPKPLWERGRGEQRTPAGKIPSYSCYACGGRDVTSASASPAPEGSGS